MTDQEILRKAAQLRAARRRRTVKKCSVCGNRFTGIAQRRYCSDRCRVAASRAREAKRQDQHISTQDAMPAPRGENEPLVDYFDRIRAAIMRGGRFTEDSTELIRRMRESDMQDGYTESEAERRRSVADA